MMQPATEVVAQLDAVTVAVDVLVRAVSLAVGLACVFLELMQKDDPWPS